MQAEPTARPIGVAIRSPRRLFRDALTTYLTAQPEFTVVGHVAEHDDLTQLCRLRAPDLILVDADRTTPAAIASLGRLRDLVGWLRIVVVYEELTPAEVTALHGIGVDTLVPSSHGMDALLVVLRQHVASLRDEVAGHAPAREALTEREQEIVALVGAGHTVRRIAELLGVPPWSVENSKRRIYHKLGTASQSQAVARAAALGLVDRPAPAQPLAMTPGSVMLAVLRGPETAARHAVVVALLANGVPFVIDEVSEAGDIEAWRGWHRGPVLTVLVDPGPADWAGLHERLPLLLVRSDPMGRTEALDALSRGVCGIISAEGAPTMLVPALTLCCAGHLIIDPVAVPTLVAVLRVKPGDPDRRLPALTAREADILRSISLGHTVRQTARLLNISEKTVQNTQARLFLKLGTRNRAGAIVAAHGLGLLDAVAEGPDAKAGNGTVTHAGTGTAAHTGSGAATHVGNGTAPTHPGDGAAQTHPGNGSAPVLPGNGAATALPGTSATAAVPGSSAAAVVAGGSSAATLAGDGAAVVPALVIAADAGPM